MPLYDYRCAHCEGIFEEQRSISDRKTDTQCPYCKEMTAVTPLMTGGFVALRVLNKWKPQSKVEELTGPNVTGPGTRPNAMRSSILHTCKGFNCSICET